MRFARSILSAIFFVMFGIGGIVFSVLLLFPLPQATARHALRSSFRFFVWAGRVTGLFRVDISPEEKLRLATLHGAVVVSNHLTLIDAVILLSIIGDSVCVTKEAVSRNVFMRAVARNVLLVNGNPIEVLYSAEKLLADGVNVLVFPEGTRTPADAPQHKFRRGAARIALAATAPVEMVSISCDPPVLGKEQPWWDVGGRTIVYSVRCKGGVDTQSEFGRGIEDESMRRSAMELTKIMHKKVFGE